MNASTTRQNEPHLHLPFNEMPIRTESKVTLIDILNVDLIRDEIMRNLVPRDAISLMLTASFKHDARDSRRYMNLFKYIFDDVNWISSKVREGYTFSLVGSQFFEHIFKMELPLRRRIPRHLVQMSKDEIISVALVITKDQRLVKCTDEFIPKHVLDMSSKSDKNPEWDHTHPYVLIETDGNRLAVLLPNIDTTVDIPVRVNDQHLDVTPVNWSKRCIRCAHMTMSGIPELVSTPYLSRRSYRQEYSSFMEFRNMATTLFKLQGLNSNWPPYSIQKSREQIQNDRILARLVQTFEDVAGRWILGKRIDDTAIVPTLAETCNVAELINRL